MPITLSLPSKPLGLLLIAGVLLGLSVTAYYLALSKGPISVVVPIFDLFIVSSSVAGVVVFGETLTLSRFLGILCVLAAMYVVSRESVPGRYMKNEKYKMKKEDRLWRKSVCTKQCGRYAPCGG
ncbi:MAG TPA: EamA family transporter [Methylomirabilota bacterium]|jgi:drug/metabolite transporter (DMT)-like permease|nr:EamA family transporter [Methylomirabilota bacterium]